MVTRVRGAPHAGSAARPRPAPRLKSRTRAADAVGRNKEGPQGMAAVAELSKRRKKRKKKRKKKPGQQQPVAPPAPPILRSTSTCSATPIPATASSANRSSTGDTPQAKPPPRPLPSPQSPPAPGAAAVRASIPGHFGRVQAKRLLDRAGFGPRRARRWASRREGLQDAVYSLTRPSGAAQLNGPEPLDDDGEPIAPADNCGHDHLWWLDRMLRARSRWSSGWRWSSTTGSRPRTRVSTSSS